ncbi:glycosyl hydrolase [Nesterenkonia sp. HG001]|uniref:glycoside hydrolase 5 family protein n=1 Tax=Nesterenkonia sp. HG001 TaxID=2983207 RepID=UPI002AC4114D|nr:glycosyl hydrolase [Nesterenkonia sp. HG001]MDZ5076894.1 glycosyl hydrolase [Nesterenkonia sp. HG001]
MRFGLNHTPRHGWFHAWQDLDLADVADDMSAIASLGVDHVRIFPLWPLIHPNRGLIRERGLADVVDVARVAHEHGLDVVVDALQGHLSSFDFLPAWLGTWHRRNMFTDPEVVSSTAEYVRRLTAAVAREPNLMGITLGNEINQFAAAPHPDPHPVDAAGGTAWLETMLGAARAETDALVTHSMYDAGWYDSTQPFGPAHAAELGDATITHSWVFNGAAQLAGGLAEESVSHAEYLTRLAQAWHPPGSARPIWLQEAGAPTTVMDPAEAPEFIRRSMRRVAQVPHLLGITWWCSHDVSRDLLDFPEVEHDLGLIDVSGRIKPTGEAFAETVAELRAEPPAATAAQAPAVIIDDLGRDPRDELGPGGAVHRAWLDARDGHAGTALTLRSQSQDQDPTRDLTRGSLSAHHLSDLPTPAPTPQRS